MTIYTQKNQSADLRTLTTPTDMHAIKVRRLEASCTKIPWTSTGKSPVLARHKIHRGFRESYTNMISTLHCHRRAQCALTCILAQRASWKQAVQKSPWSLTGKSRCPRGTKFTGVV